MNTLYSVVFSALVLLFITNESWANNTEDQTNTWVKPVPVFDQKYDWLRLTSDEWLKGDILSLYDNELEFDSEKLDRQIFDWEDVAELRSRFDQQIRLDNGRVLEGFLIVKEGKVTILSDGKAHDFPLSELMTITASGHKRKNLWSGRLGLGLNYSAGNVTLKDITSTGKIERKSPFTRFRADILINFSEIQNKDQPEPVVNADSRRITSYVDWFYNSKIFFRVLDFEHFSDALQNINARNTFGAAFGYHIIDNKRVSWDVTLGPSYQKSSFEASISSESEDSAVLSIGTLLEYEYSSSIDFVIDYQLQFVNEKSGKRINNLKTGVSIDIFKNIDLDFNFYLDRMASPIIDSENVLPEKNDYRLLVSFNYDF